jgi:phage terminase small subunit
MALSNRQQAFVNEYTRSFNATKAATVAGYSAKTAYSIGSRLLKNVEVSTAIKEAVEMPPDEVKARLADIARGDIADLMALSTGGFTFELLVRNEAGELVPNPKTKLIRKIKQKVTTYLAKTEDGEDREIIETELELYDAQAALVTLGKYHKLFIERTDITSGGNPIVQRIEVAIPPEEDNGSA